MQNSTAPAALTPVQVAAALAAFTPAQLREVYLVLVDLDVAAVKATKAPKSRGGLLEKAAREHLRAVRGGMFRTLIALETGD